MLYNHHQLPLSKLFISSVETLYQLNMSCLVLLPPVPDKHHSAPQLYESNYCKNLLWVEITPFVSFFDRFIPFSIMITGFIHVVAFQRKSQAMCFLHGFTCMEKNSFEIHPDPLTCIPLVAPKMNTEFPFSPFSPGRPWKQNIHLREEKSILLFLYFL